MKHDAACKDDTLACLWWNLPRAARERICKQHGFSDYMTYANYRWAQFQPHTRAKLATRVQLESDAASGFNRNDYGTNDPQQ